MNVQIYGITYGDKTTEYIPYQNDFTEKLWRFEYNPMIDICDNLIADLQNDDYLGILSWKFQSKTGFTKDWLLKVLQGREAMRENVSVYNLSPNLGNNIGNSGCFMDWSAKGHGETLRELIKACCKHTGLTYHNNPRHIVYANQFIAKKEVYLAYMNTVVKPSLELMEGKLWRKANIPAQYTAGVDSATLKKHTGLDFYNYIPFVLERMMMQFIQSNNLKTMSLI